ncbi:MAG: hypothetical protein A3K03_09805, partial [Bdellovibrionales bacterium RIFOXYD1_FULL_44_7]
FQPVADLLKLLQKQISGKDSQSDLWSFIQVMGLYSTILVLPLGSGVLLVDTDMSVFLPFLGLLILAFSTTLIGLNQSTIPGFFGGVRVAAISISIAFPILLTVLTAGLQSGGFRWSVIANFQGASPFSWNALTNPFQFIAFLVFVISGLIFVGVSPIDAGFSGKDIEGGIGSHLSGRWLSMYRFGRFYSFFLWSIMAVVLFLGAWRLPEAITSVLRDIEAWRSLFVLEASVLLVKTLLLMLLVLIVSTVTPRIRADQVTDLGLKVLSPFAMVALVGAAIWIGRAAL